MRWLNRDGRRRAWAVTILFASAGAGWAQSAPAEAPPSGERTEPTAEARGFVVEGYYRFRWGAEQEFFELYRKNHVPFLKRMLEKGSLLEARLEKPREHLPEESRWDLRVTLVYRDAAAAFGYGEIDEVDYLAIAGEGEAERRFLAEERRRFELLEAHWDVNVQPIEELQPTIER